MIGAALLASGCAGGIGVDPSAATESVTPGALYSVVRAGSGKCLDIADNSTADGAKLQQWACWPSPNQTFRVDSAANGAVKLVSPTSGKCVDISGAGTADSTKVQLYTCNGTVAQSWVVEDVGGGYARVRNPNSGKCLDVQAASAADGAQLQIYTCNGTSAQSWQFNMIGGGNNGGSGGAAGSGGTGGTGGTSGNGGGNCPPSWNVTDACGGPVSGKAPDFGANVAIFDPSMAASTIQGRLNQINSQQETSEFGSGRYAYFFKPGTYNGIDVKIGFYTQMLGLGQSPDAVKINGAVRAKADYLGDNNATCNFWRAAENYAVSTSGNIDGGTGIWATSQGTALRRVHYTSSLNLSDGGWSSGGFIADSLIDGTINSGSQQQYLTRNDDMRWNGQSWNMVFVGDSGAPGGSWPNVHFTVVGQTPKVREKPFLYLDNAGNYLVMVPALKSGSQGRSWASGAAPGSPLSIDRFYVAHAGDSAATLNAQLAAGKHLFFTPGIYSLDAPLVVARPNTILLGIGLATLRATKGNTLVSVADVDGVTVAGLLLEAGSAGTQTLLQLGTTGGASHAANPSLLADLFCRSGGQVSGSIGSCVTINSNDAILDNLWLWRADHGTGGSDWYNNRAPNGLIVNGANVIAYGLFVEHFQQYQTLWNGNGGQVYFYQSEMPYDVPNQGAWNAPGDQGYPSYKVADGVTTHTAKGIGVYSVFSNYVTATNGIEAPGGGGIAMNHMVSVSLASGQILHVYDGQFGPVGNGTQQSYSTY